MTPPSTLRRAAPALVLALLPCLLLWRVVFAGDVFLPADLLRDVAPWRVGNPGRMVPWNPLMWDGIAEFYPWRLLASVSLKQGCIPLWNPHEFCGTPFVANSQSAVFYPLNLLFVLIPVTQAFGVSVLLHLFLTGLFLYLFLRSRPVGLGRTAALVGAVTWQLSTWQTSWLALPTFLGVSTWLPLALLLTDRVVARPGAARAAALGACLGLMLLAGHLQIALYCLLFTAAYAAFRLVSARRLLRGDWASVAGCAALAAAVLFGLAAPQLLPALELARVSHRAGAPLNWQSYEGYVRLALPPVNLVTLWLPGFFGNPAQGTYWGVMTNGGPSAYMENACYVGVLSLLLALAGTLLTWRSAPTTRFFALGSALALLLALGTPLDALLYFGIPGFGQSGSPGRILVLWTFCAAVLAAVGAEALLKREKLPVKTLAAAGASFATLFALVCAYTAMWIGTNAPVGTLAAQLGREGDLWRPPVGILLGAAALFWLRQRRTLTDGAAGCVLVALVAADLLAANSGYNRTAPPSHIYPVTPGIAFLQQNAGFERVMPLNRGWSLDPAHPPVVVLPPNTGIAYGLHDTQGYDSLLTGQYFRFAEVLNGGEGPAPPENGNIVFTNGYASPEAQETAARYLVSREPLPPDAALRLVSEGSDMRIYENRRALPRARVVAGTGTAAIQRETPTRLTVGIAGAGAGGRLVVADQWYPGWQAWVNGHVEAVTAGPDVFRTVAWSGKTGPVRVEMRYWPTTFRVGLYLFCMALATLAGIASAHIGVLRRRG